MGYSFRLTTEGLFYMHHPTDRIAHTTTFVTPVVEHWLEWEIVQWVHHEGSIRWPITPWANALTTELHLAPSEGRKDGSALFNDAFNTFYLRLYCIGHIVKDHSVSEETCCHHFIGYSDLAARDVLYARYHRQYIPWPLIHQLWNTSWNKK